MSPEREPRPQIAGLVWEIRRVLSEIEEFPRPTRKKWWETDEYRALVARLREAVARLEAVEGR